MNDHILTKLSDNFDDLKERLIRIEENVRSIKDVKEEVDVLKIKANSLDSSTKSAHKRLDQMENDQRWMKRQLLGGMIGGGVTIITSILLAIIKGWI